jgi:hypothetical protein
MTEPLGWPPPERSAWETRCRSMGMLRVVFTRGARLPLVLSSSAPSQLCAFSVTLVPAAGSRGRSSHRICRLRAGT